MAQSVMTMCQTVQQIRAEMAELRKMLAESIALAGHPLHVVETGRTELRPITEAEADKLRIQAAPVNFDRMWSKSMARF